MATPYTSANNLGLQLNDPRRVAFFYCKLQPVIFPSVQDRDAYVFAHHQCCLDCMKMLRDGHKFLQP